MWSSAVTTRAELSISGITAKTLAKDFGTPTFFIDEADFCERALAWDKALKDAFGANVDLRDCYSQDNNYRLNIMYDINSGTVDTTSWSTLTVSRSGYTSFTISRSSLSTNAVTVGNYYMTTPSNTLTSTQFYMISGGTVTLTFT